MGIIKENTENIENTKIFTDRLQEYIFKSEKELSL